MRRLIPAFVLVLAASLAGAQEPAAKDPGSAQGKKEMTAIVVSADATVKTITVRKEGAAMEAAPETLTVAGAAVARLSSIKAGEKVKLVLTTDPATSAVSVTSIEKPKAPSDKP
jgi:Cu/Ag efflux protein CusF